MIKLRVFKHAINGIIELIKTETNAQFHLVGIIGVITAGYWFEIPAMEWVSLILCMGLVLCLEAVNTATEKLCDFIHPKYHRSIGTIKDICAGSVLIAAIVAVIIGVLVFVPHIQKPAS